MAFSSVRVQLEIGHEASVRNKRTPEGFTHDWEVFVRGGDNTEIHHFVDKVVFHLHETFPKPKRVIKVPPYSVKECGYAGFVIPIDVYLKNAEEPKKISFQYDLQLQSSGPPISRVLREPRVFQNPSEDFRRKLIRGGGVGVDNPPDHPTQPRPPRPPDDHQLKPVKKHKPELPIQNSFTDLFGTPIRRGTPEPKKALEIKKDDKKSVGKVGGGKDMKGSEKKEKDRDKTKDKEKRPSSPPHLTAQKIKDEVKKPEERERSKEDVVKSDKERKDKHKDVDRNSKKDKKSKDEPEIKKEMPMASVDKPGSSAESDKKEKHKHKHKKKEREKSRDERHKHKDREKREERPVPVEPVKHEKPKSGLHTLFNELSDSGSLSEDDPPPPKLAKLSPPEKRSKSSREEKRKDKSPKKRSVKYEEVESKKPKLDRRDRSSSPEAELSKRVREDRERDEKIREEAERRQREREELERRQREKEEADRRQREREIREREEAERKQKEREDAERKARIEEDRKHREEQERRQKEREEEAKRQKEKEAEARKAKSKKDKEKRRRRDEGEASTTGVAEEQTAVAPPAVTAPTTEGTLSDDYLAQLRVLAAHINQLRNCPELQEVVQVIRDSGQYEVTPRTFDFDLCSLNPDIVRRLQSFLHLPTAT